MRNPANPAARRPATESEGRGRALAAAPRRGRIAAAWQTAGDFAGAVVRKAQADNIFFMAGAIAFNVIVAFVPLLLAALGIAGTILRFQEGADPTERVVAYLIESLPPVSDEFQGWVRRVLDEVVGRSTGLLGIGTVFLIWVATRLIGTLRTALREIFDIQDGRGIIAGKLFDMKMVVAAGTLLALNVGLTVAARILAVYGSDLLGIEAGELPLVRGLFGWFAALLTIWVMFLLMYRYLPPRRIQWRVAVVAATFTAVLYEFMKQAFGWYIGNISEYDITYGSLAVLIILILWIYYTAVAFILGGEVAQVYAMRRIRRQQKERLR